MEDKTSDAIETDYDADAPQDPPPPISSPSVEGNKDGTSSNGEADSGKIEKCKEDPPHWTKYVEAICGVAIVIITAYYAYYARQQAGAAITAANAAASAASTASSNLEKMQKQIDAANAANELSKTLVKGEFAAIVDLSIPSEPDSLSKIMAGLSAQFVNKGKVDATNFSATTTLQQVSLPSFLPIGKTRSISIWQPRLLPLSAGHGGPESVAFTTFDMSGFREYDITAIKHESSTLKMDTTYSYTNGFGETFSNRRCYLYLYVPAVPPDYQAWNSWDDCTMAKNVYRSYFKRNKKK